MLHKTAKTEIMAHYEKIKSHCYIWGKKTSHNCDSQCKNVFVISYLPKLFKENVFWVKYCI